MKNKITLKSLLILACLIFSLAACSSDKEDPQPQKPQKETPKPKDPAAEPIQSFLIANYPEAEVDINESEKKINIVFNSPVNLKALKIDLVLKQGVKILEPVEVYDLSSEYTLVLSNNSHEQEYKVTASSTAVADYTGWTINNNYGELPEHITLYSATNIQGKDGIGYIAVVDMTKEFSVDVLGEEKGVKTPSTFYDEIPADKKPTILVNAGYFHYNPKTKETYGVSLLIREGQLLKTNTVSSSGYYPTRSAFGIDNDGKIEINWVYTKDASSATFAYPTPAPNILGTTPLPKPFRGYPKGSKVWRLETAVGAGPIAVKNGKARTFEEMKYELLSGAGDAERPRGAVGLTPDNKMIFYVNQGNEFDGYFGFTWEEVGKEMLKLGCYDVLHFDGGGSICMLINGIPVIKGGEVPSNNNPNGDKQRAVATVLAIR